MKLSDIAINHINFNDGLRDIEAEVIRLNVIEVKH